MSENQKRLISKIFFCENCKSLYKKLVNIKTSKSICSKCNKICIEKNNKEEEKNYNEDTKLRKNILSMIKPFSISPFSKSLKKSNFDFSKILGDGKINTPTENFFIDNYSSNFISNFYNPMSRIVYSQLCKNNFINEKSLPLNDTEIKQIKQFKLKEFHCKKVNNDIYENPNCLSCLKDIKLEDNSVLLRCGHLFHYNCFIEFISKHSICPFCKFDIINKTISIFSDNEKDNLFKIEVGKTLMKNNEKIDDVIKNHSNINIMGINKDFLELLI